MQDRKEKNILRNTKNSKTQSSVTVVNCVEAAFGKYIAQRRKEKGLSQMDVAEKIGVSQSLIDYWEKGKRSICLKDAIIVCAELDGDIRSFVDDFVYYSVL